LRIKNQESKIGDPLILAVETSGRCGSVAIAQGARLLSEQYFSGPMRHSAEIFPAIVKLSERGADIGQVYISVGPGSFTGLRIAVTIAKAFALANQAKIVPVDTLDCIAANVIPLAAENAEAAEYECEPDGRLAAILDAKRGQFFVAVYDRANRESQVTGDGIWQKILPDCLMAAEQFLEKFAGSDRPIALVGEGLVYYKSRFTSPNVRVLDEKFWNPSAANVHRLGWYKARVGDFTDPIRLTPNYLRQPDVKIKRM
jgi:tRNA threonylcarbamoyladenosine biosynthesis protein TsaB